MGSRAISLSSFEHKTSHTSVINAYGFKPRKLQASNGLNKLRVLFSLCKNISAARVCCSSSIVLPGTWSVSTLCFSQFNGWLSPSCLLHCGCKMALSRQKEHREIEEWQNSCPGSCHLKHLSCPENSMQISLARMKFMTISCRWEAGNILFFFFLSTLLLLAE